jgi:SMC interacting uncharacterized protein involved in chromosome segregation
MQLQIDLAKVNEKYKERIHALTDENLLLQVAVDQLQDQLAQANRTEAALRDELAKATTESDPFDE